VQGGLQDTQAHTQNVSNDLVGCVFRFIALGLRAQKLSCRRKKRSNIAFLPISDWFYFRAAVPGLTFAFPHRFQQARHGF
jgi:hypothetical protein